MTPLQRIEIWFKHQCDGDWEHGEGIVISSLDNPGWSVDIDLRGTTLKDHCFLTVKREASLDDWLHASTTGRTFKIRCGPMNLEEAIVLFCDWAEVSAC
jgi:hypothetical protein